MSEAVADIVKPVSFEGEVWKTLSRVDCSKQIEKKQNLSYLSWAWAWAILMERYPQSEYAFDPPQEFADGTYEVWVSVTIREGEHATTRRMWLPCIDYKNQPVKNPTSFQINTTRMRCLTKCLAMFGLGHYIYAGEDLPRPENDAPPVGEKKDNSVAGAVLDGETFDEGIRESYVHGILVCISTGDDAGLAQLLDELHDDQIMKVAIWHKLGSKERSFIKRFEAARRAEAA